MKTSTTAIIASVAVLIAVGMFYNSSSLNPKTSSDAIPVAYAATTTTPVSSDGYFTFSSGKDSISKGKFIGSGFVGTVDQTFAVVPYDASTLETLAVNVAKAPGNNKTWIFTVYVNGAVTDLECEISGSAKTCTSEDVSADADANDTVNVKVRDVEGKSLKKTGASATVTVQP